MKVSIYVANKEGLNIAIMIRNDHILPIEIPKSSYVQCVKRDWRDSAAMTCANDHERALPSVCHSLVTPNTLLDAMAEKSKILNIKPCDSEITSPSLYLIPRFSRSVIALY